MVGRRLFQYAMYFKKIIFTALFMLTIAVTAEVLSPFVAKIIIDDHIMANQPDIPTIIKLIVLYFSLFVIAGIFNYGQYYFLQKAANRIIERMRNELFRKIQTLPILYFDNRQEK